ncbi:hypothetical protein FPZ42_12125 [Mucilaginibacter achroorhodeus]|uniref:O-antigen ligase-like membrane protein n=1 Tax=Mucilaginibacter achroorhodeus TaxID=2599294 RepID=A0A563U153_9SPHI|nr:hypothetical protein [Mucilaginibacter achroorhodeus]TWR25346.1 hypothetical protein FPZ42_12125 [Mucilaginibacter achroorhodeus]
METENRLTLFKSEFWIVLVCTICLQFPDLKIAGLQPGELLMLLLMPFLFKHLTKSKTILYFLAFYILLLVKTLIVNHYTNFYINDENLTLLKNPGFISFARFLEMLTCMTFCCFTANVLSHSQKPYNLLKMILFVQIMVFGLFFMLTYSLYALHLLATDKYESLIVYDASEGDQVYRLKGFFVEGGPFGLFYAFIFTVCVACYRRLRLKPLYLIIPVILVLLGQSKAGYLLLFLNGAVYLMSKVGKFFKRLFVKILLYIAVIVLMVFGSIATLQMYVDSLSDIELKASLFAPGEIDPNFMMGRISATVIVPNMLAKNAWVGIGWGNYPLLRNNPAYRQFMPEIPVSFWDATGLGGIVDMLLEAGIIFFIIYLLLYFRLAKTIRPLPASNYLILALIGPLLLGVAIYFFYTWLLMGVLFFLMQTELEPKEKALNE